jgi:hypothetical protein
LLKRASGIVAPGENRRGSRNRGRVLGVNERGQRDLPLVGTRLVALGDGGNCLDGDRVAPQRREQDRVGPQRIFSLGNDLAERSRQPFLERGDRGGFNLAGANSLRHRLEAIARRVSIGIDHELQERRQRIDVRCRTVLGAKCRWRDKRDHKQRGKEDRPAHERSSFLMASGRRQPPDRVELVQDGMPSGC